MAVALHFLPELVVLVAALLVVLLDLWLKRHRQVLRWTALAGIALGLASIVPLALRSPAGAEGLPAWAELWRADGFALFFKTLFLVSTGLVLLADRRFVEEHRLPEGELYAMLLFATLGMIMMASSHNLIIIYIGLELMGITGYALSGLDKSDPRSSEAALKYFLLGAVSSSILLFGLSLVYGLTGSLALETIGKIFAVPESGVGLAGVAVLLLLVGFGFKIAAVPFHMWVPDTYQGSPTPVTAFLSVGPKAAGFAALLSLFVTGLPRATGFWQPLLAGVAVLTMTLGNLAALSQTNLKRLMGYSSISHTGYVLAGLAVATPYGFRAMLFYLAAYAFVNLAAFAIIIAVGTHRRAHELSDYRGLGQHSAFMAIALAIFFFSLIGIPPTAGFFGKLYLFGAAIEKGYVGLALVMVLNGVLSVPYYYAVIKEMFMNSPESSAPPITWPRGVKAAVIAGLVVALGLGLGSDPLLRAATAVINAL